MRALFVIGLMGCAGGGAGDEAESWNADGIGAPPGELSLTLSVFIPGEDARITVSGVSIDEEAHIALTTAEDGPAFCPGAVGLCLDLPRPVVYLGVADERGDDWLSLRFPVPPRARIGTPVYMQAVMDSWPDGWYLSPVGETMVDWGGCPDVWDPVCGVDGVTYGNDCEAASMGWPIAHEGPC